MSAALLFLPLAAQAQDEAARKQALEVAARVPFEKPVKGAPYSADTVVESTQTLADGNHINRKTSGHVYRDSEGRVRREDERSFSMMSPGGPVSHLMMTVSIIDPVAGFSYSLDSEHKIAWKTPEGAGGMIMNKVEALSAVEKQKAESEFVVRKKQMAEGTNVIRGEEQNVAELKARRGFSVGPETPLEHRTIEGLAVEGRKTSTVIPAGPIGNEQPITITSEEWTSPELHVLVMTHHNDPRSGESSYRLTNIVRAEPDRSLFMVPSDYTIKDTGIRRNHE